MTCNCDNDGSNEYIIELGEFGLPGAKGDRGEQGYSPVVSYTTNSDTIQFTLVNENSTLTTPNYYDYLAKKDLSNTPIYTILSNYPTNSQVADTYLSKSDAVTTYLKVDGTNANNPITIDGLQIRNNSGYITLGTSTTTTINTQARAINFVETDSNGDQQSLIQMGSTGNINVRATGTLTLGGSGTRPSYSQAGGTAKSLALYTDIPDISTKLNTDGSNASNPITIDGHTFESLYGGSNTKLTMTGSPAYIEAPTLVLRSTDTGKVYYKSSNVNNELATIGDINDATITITQGGVTKGTFTLNQSGNATIALDAGGSASTNPIVLKTIDESRSLALGLNNDTKKAYMTYTISTGGMDLPLPVRLIAGKSAPITLTETNEGLTTIGLDYDTNSLGLDTNNKLAVDSNYIEAHKAYLADGDTLTDPQGLEDVRYYNYSSFDASKFNIVGSLTVTDGVASGFSSSNYAETTGITFGSGSWEIGLQLTTPADITALTSGVAVLGVGGTYGIQLRFYSQQLYLSIQDDSNTNIFSSNPKFSVTASTKYLIKFGYDTENYYYKYSTDNGSTWVTVGTQISASLVKNYGTSQVIHVGVHGFSGQTPYPDAIDLKPISVIVNGQDVFSGNKTGVDTYTVDSDTITIPYKISKTGSKIVDSSRRPEVEAVYEDQGYALYYTLDEANGNFTLPMGEIYGYITRLEGIVKDLQTRLTALETNINAGGAGVVQQSLLGMSPLSFSRPQLLGEFNPEDEMNTMDIEPIEEDIQEEELEPQETEEETEEGGEDE